MADTLIVFYSLEGNVDFVARALAKELGADLCRLETEKEYPKKGLLKFFHGGKDAVAGLKPALKTALPDTAPYAKVVIAAPVWAGKPAAPINTFLEQADLSGKKVFAFTSSAGGNGDKALAMMLDAAKKKGGEAVASESFTNAAKHPDISLEKVRSFAEKIK